MRKLIGVAAFLTYVGTVFASNYLVAHFGIVPVGFGLMAPAAVYAVGVAFTARDITQRYLGRLATLAAVLIGAGLSYTVSPTFATASAAAFLVSEMADMAVYTPLADRRWMTAVVASNIVGSVLDSAVFLWLAFGSLAFLQGQVVGKLTMTAAAIFLITMVRAFRQAKTVTA